MRANKVNLLLVILCLSVAHLSHAVEPSSSTQDSTHSEGKNTDQTLQKLVDEIKSYSSEKREEAVKKAKFALAELDKRIETLEWELDRKWQIMDKEALAQTQRTLKALREQRIMLAEWYGGLVNGSVNAWEELKYSFVDTYKALLEALDMAEREQQK